ncbi:MAG TPA: P-loop NTPase fold protein [Candidatus Bathyarchaeia archaeon]|nr:P-loop NTPase fold protein [Candidatus Bathyarchaeia archaeon]
MPRIEESPKSGITKIITDEPTEDDALDFNKYSQKLADIIANSTPRFAIGVFGGWGTGKTSLMQMTKKILDDNSKIVTVWFDAWRYEREQNVAVIPFLRTIKLTIDASEKSKEGKWQGVKNGIKRSAAAFLTSTKITYGIKDVVSAETDLGNVADSLKGDGTVGDDRGNIYYYVTQFIEKALKDLREDDTNYRIVVFIDDLDRCSPDRALEVLESIKSFFDIEGIVYVIGMDSETINFLVKKKYGEESAVKGLDYLQKIRAVEKRHQLL